MCQRSDSLLIYDAPPWCGHFRREPSTDGTPNPLARRHHGGLSRLVVAQLVNIQLVQEHKLADSPNNPINSTANLDNERGEILASDGTVLAQSVPSPAGSSAEGYPYDYLREYPQKSLYSDITGYDSILDFGMTDVEAEYDSFLGPHHRVASDAQSVALSRETPLDHRQRHAHRGAQAPTGGRGSARKHLQARTRTVPSWF